MKGSRIFFALALSMILFAVLLFSACGDKNDEIIIGDESVSIGEVYFDTQDQKETEKETDASSKEETTDITTETVAEDVTVSDGDDGEKDFEEIIPA